MKYLKSKFWVTVVFAGLFFVSCNKNDDANEATPQPEVVEFGTAPSSTIITTGFVDVITENTVRYHTIDFAAAPYTVTIVETADNIVIVDLGPAPDFAVELEAYVDAINKPGTVIITHNHGDHYGGAVNFTDLDFYAESTVAEQLNNSASFTSLYPKSVIPVSGSQEIGGMAYTFDKVSNAETGENGYFYNEEHKVVFAGDLVYNLTHPFLREYTPNEGADEIDNWIAGLNLLKTNFSDYDHLFVGHNGSRSDVGTVIDENIDYLQNAQSIIKGTKSITGGGSATTQQEIVDELQLLYPNYKEGGLLLSLPDAFFPGDPGASWFSIVEFGDAPSGSLITTGIVNVITENTVRYHTIDFAAAPYTVTIVETADNIVIVDLGPAPDFAIELEAYVDAINKSGAVIITHNHGDHYGGAVNFANLEFYAESTVADQLNNSASFTSLYPKSVIGVSGSQEIGGLTYTFDKVSNAETGENGYFYNEEHKVVFSGDLVYNMTHPFLREYTPNEGADEIDNWVAGLNLLKTNFSDYNHLFVGHNGSRSDVGTVIDENIDYLQNAQSIIKGTKSITGGGSATTQQEIVDELLVLYPDYKEGGLLLSLPDAFFPGDPGAAWF